MRLVMKLIQCPMCRSEVVMNDCKYALIIVLFLSVIGLITWCTLLILDTMNENDSQIINACSVSYSKNDN